MWRFEILEKLVLLFYYKYNNWEKNDGDGLNGDWGFIVLIGISECWDEVCGCGLLCYMVSLRFFFFWVNIKYYKI